jgi:hypothetical protein
LAAASIFVVLIAFVRINETGRVPWRRHFRHGPLERTG